MTELDTGTFTLTNNGVQSSMLTRSEVNLLSALITRKPMTKQVLIDRLYPFSRMACNIVVVHISNLRKKLEPLNLRIVYRDESYLVEDIEPLRLVKIN